MVHKLRSAETALFRLGRWFDEAKQAGLAQKLQHLLPSLSLGFTAAASDKFASKVLPGGFEEAIDALLSRVSRLPGHGTAEVVSCLVETADANGPLPVRQFGDGVLGNSFAITGNDSAETLRSGTGRISDRFCPVFEISDTLLKGYTAG
jgi:hypothetical protein